MKFSEKEMECAPTELRDRIKEHRREVYEALATLYEQVTRCEESDSVDDFRAAQTALRAAADVFNRLCVWVTLDAYETRARQRAMLRALSARSWRAEQANTRETAMRLLEDVTQYGRREA